MSSLASAQPVRPIEPRAFRGILIALLLSLPVWLLVIWIIGRFIQ